MDWKYHALALPRALFLLFLAFSFAGDTPAVIAEDEPVAADGLIDPNDIDGFVLGQDCDEDSEENGDSSKEKGDEDSESEDADEDEDGDEDSCDEEEDGEDEAEA